jgi:hypothetical protein
MGLHRCRRVAALQRFVYIMLGRQVARVEVDRLEQAVASARASRLFGRTRPA